MTNTPSLIIHNYIASYSKYTLYFKKPAGTSRGYLHHKDVYYLKLISRNNPTVFGLGECSPQPGLSLDARPDFEEKLRLLCVMK